MPKTSLSRFDKTFRFFSYAIALYWIFNWVNFLAQYFPVPEVFHLPVILSIAIHVLHIASHAAVIAVVYYLGRKKLSLFLVIQLLCSISITIAYYLARTSFHFNVLLMTNVLFGLLYSATLFLIQNTPFNALFKWLAISEILLPLIFTICIFLSLPTHRMLILIQLIPVTILFILVQKARRHLAKAELEAGFLEEVDVRK